MENEYHIITEGIKRVVSRDELEDLKTFGKDPKLDVEWYHSHGYSVDAPENKLSFITVKLNKESQIPVLTFEEVDQSNREGWSVAFTFDKMLFVDDNRFVMGGTAIVCDEQPQKMAIGYSYKTNKFYRATYSNKGTLRKQQVLNPDYTQTPQLEFVTLTDRVRTANDNMKHLVRTYTKINDFGDKVQTWEYEEDGVIQKETNTCINLDKRLAEENYITLEEWEKEVEK